MNQEQKQTTEPTLNDVLLAVKDGFDGVDSRFDGVDSRFDKVEGSLNKVEKDVGILKTTMVTKGYLDDKLADLGAEIGKRIERAMVKEKRFHEKLLGLLKRHNIGQPEEIQELEAMIR